MKRTLILSLFLFGWLLLFEACNTCKGGESRAICVQRNSIQAVAYNLGNGKQVEQGESILSSDLVIDALAVISEETCMRSLSGGGALMACSPAPPYYYKFDTGIEEITIVSDAMIAQGYSAGSDLSALLETVIIDTPEAGKPIELIYREASSAFLFYVSSAHKVPPGYDDSYYKSFSRDVLRFKENVDLIKGAHNFTIEWILSDDSVLSSTIEITIE